MKKVKSLLSLILAVLMVAGCVATASAAAAKTEVEPTNNDFATANEFKVGEEITGKIADTADKDYFVFNATKAGIATISLEHTANSATSTYFTVEILDADGKSITSFVSAGNSASASAVVSVDKDTLFYVLVTGGDVVDPTLGYAVSVAITEVALSESEPNDKATEADKLEYSPSGTPKEYYGTISAGDKDYYKVTIPADGVVNLYLYNHAANAGDYTATLKTYVEVGGVQKLYDVTSIEIAKSETSEVGPSVGVAKGDYYLEIVGKDSTTAGSYKTRVLFREVANVETEMNDSAATADAVAIGKTYKATLDAANDVDYFKFTVPAANEGYDFEFKSTNAGDWTFKFFDSDNGKIIDPVTLKATNDNKVIKAETKKLEAGTYYIAVSAGDINDTGIYELKISAKVPAEDDNKDDGEKTESLFDRIAALDWGGLWDNFSGWIEEINFLGMFSNMFASILKALTYLGSMA